jgi:hypothetical protein
LSRNCAEEEKEGKRRGKGAKGSKRKFPFS